MHIYEVCGHFFIEFFIGIFGLFEFLPEDGHIVLEPSGGFIVSEESPYVVLGIRRF